MRKTDGQTLTTKERSRYQISSEFFSKGASIELQKQFMNSQIEKFKKNDSKFEKIKKEKKKKKITKGKAALTVAGFLAIASVAGVIGYVVIDKLKDAASYTKQQMDITLDRLPDEDRNKILNFAETIKGKLDENLVYPIKDGLQALFGRDSNRLKNEKLRKKGVWGTLLPDFGLLSVIHVFRKQGYIWVLDMLNVKQPHYHYLVKGMWDVFIDDPTGYMVMGRSLFEGAGFQQQMKESIEKQQVAAVDYKNEARTEWINDEGVEDNNEVITSVLQHYSDHRRIMHENKFTYVEIQEYSLRTFDWEGEQGQQYKDYNEDYSNEEFQDYVPDYKESNRVVKSPSNFLYINDIYELQVHLHNLYKDYDIYSYQKLGKWWGWLNTHQPGQGTGDGEFWTANKVNVVLQMNAAVTQWQLYQELNSVTAARAFYADMFTEAYNQEVLAGMSEELMRQKRTAEPWQRDFAKGRISLDQYLEQMRVSLAKIVEKKFLSNLREIFTLKRQEYQSKIKSLRVKEMAASLDVAFKKYKLFNMTGGRQIIKITKETFRENFDHSNKEGIRFEQFDGEFFDGTTIKSETIYSDGTLKRGHDRTNLGFEPANVVRIYGQQPHLWQMLWKKTTCTGMPSDYEWGWQRISNQSNAYYYVHGGWDDGDDLWGMGDDNNSAGRLYPDWAKNGWIQVVPTTVGDDSDYFYYFLRKPLGHKELMRYEVIGSDGKYYIVDLVVWRDTSFRILAMDEVKREPSKSSNAALFFGQYTTQEEGVGIKEQIINLLDVADLSEKRKSELLKERYQLLNEIINNKQGDSFKFYEIS